MIKTVFLTSAVMIFNQDNHMAMVKENAMA